MTLRIGVDTMQTKLFENRINDQISEDFYEILESIGTIRNIEKGTYLFHEGMDAQEIYLIKSGLIHIGKYSSTGKELSLRICKSGDLVGELTLFCHDPKFFLSSKIIKSGTVLAINRVQLEQKLMTNAPLAFESMKWVSTHMRKFQSMIKDLVLNGRRGALYSTLIRLSNSFGVKQNNGILIDLVLTNQELASFCACTRESANRMLTELRKLNVISISSSGKILIKDLQYLKIENGCENCPIDICTIN